MRTALRTLAALLTLGAAVPALAQERIEPDQAEQFARKFAELAREFADPPIKTDVDPATANGLHQEEHGAMVIAQKGLDADALAKPADSPRPVGQLWMRRLRPVIDDRRVEPNALRIIDIKIEDHEAKVTCYLLALGKTDAGPVLLVFGKGKEPIARLKLTTLDKAVDQDEPIELEGEKETDETGLITLKLAGKFKASMIVTALDD